MRSSHLRNAATGKYANLAVAAGVTFALKAAKVPDGRDATRPDDYLADRHDPRPSDEPDLVTA